MTIRYVNLSTNRVIDPATIVSNTSDGIVCFEDKVWKFIPADHIYKDQAAHADDPIEIPERKYRQAGIEISETLEPVQEDSILNTFYGYYFGLTEAAAVRRKYHERSAFVSDSINVEPNHGYELIVQCEQPEKTSLEFYIIDGIQEKPILPNNTLEIKNEKLFLDLPLRFLPVDDISIYNNFKLVSATLENVNLNTSDIMTANYKTSSDSQIVTPSHDTVRIKTIFRCYPGATKPPIVYSLILQRRN